MPDCGEYDYQAIEYRGLFDLKDAQIIRAEIDSIDAVNNCAAVTLLDTCELAEWIDTSAVPIFYHCENSTGTVEDLANGYKAFSVGDMVYVLANKENGEIPAQTYIIGHIDRRDTAQCGTEYIAVSASIGIGSGTAVVRTIVDLVSGNVLDLASFVDRDGSPARPSSIPFIDNTGWFAYNFTFNANTIYTFPFTVTKHSETSLLADSLYDSYTSGLVPHTVDIATAYTGMDSVSSPYTCSDLSLGNGMYESTDTFEGEYDDTGAQVKEHFSLIRSNASKAAYGSGCAAFFTSLTHNTEREYTYPDDTIYVSITDSYTSVTSRAEISKVETEAFTARVSGVNNTATISASYEAATTFSMDFSAFAAGTYTASDEISWEAVGTVPAPPANFTFGYSSATSASCSDDSWEIPNMRFNGVAGSDLSRFVLFGGTANDKVISIGTDYVCTVWGGIFYRELQVPASTVSPVSVAAAITGLPWGEDGPAAYVGTTGYRYTATPIVFATVTPAAQLTLYPLYEGATANRFSITDCLAHVSNTKSIALSIAISDMISFMQSTIADDTVFSNVNNAYQYLVSGGISIYSVKIYGT